MTGVSFARSTTLCHRETFSFVAAEGCVALCSPGGDLASRASITARSPSSFRPGSYHGTQLFYKVMNYHEARSTNRNYWSNQWGTARKTGLGLPSAILDGTNIGGRYFHLKGKWDHSAGLRSLGVTRRRCALTCTIAPTLPIHV